VTPPEDLCSRAYRHPTTGDLAWLRQDALLVTRELASQGQAILGGEAWMLLGTMRHLLRSTPPEGYYTWDTSRHADESWEDFTRRSRGEADAAILNDRPLVAAEVPTEGHIYYNLTWVSENEYADLKAPSRR
jgi:hypothetical protein